MGRHVPLLNEVLEHNRRSGINISGLFYTEVDEVAEITHLLLAERHGVNRAVGSIPSAENDRNSTE